MPQLQSSDHTRLVRVPIAKSSSVPDPRSRGSLVALGSYFVLYGGCSTIDDSGRRLKNDVFVLRATAKKPHVKQPQTHSWKRLHTLHPPQARTHCAALTDGLHLIIHGGYGENGTVLSSLCALPLPEKMLSDMTYMYYPGAKASTLLPDSHPTPQWITLSDDGPGLCGHTAAQVESQSAMYFIGGMLGDGSYSSLGTVFVFSLQIATNAVEQNSRWHMIECAGGQQLPPVVHARSATTNSQTHVIVTGSAATSPLDIFILNLATHSWSSVNLLVPQKNLVVSTLLGGDEEEEDADADKLDEIFYQKQIYNAQTLLAAAIEPTSGSLIYCFANGENFLAKAKVVTNTKDDISSSATDSTEYGRQIQQLVQPKKVKISLEKLIQSKGFPAFRSHCCYGAISANGLLCVFGGEETPSQRVERCGTTVPDMLDGDLFADVERVHSEWGSEESRAFYNDSYWISSTRLANWKPTFLLSEGASGANQERLLHNGNGIGNGIAPQQRPSTQHDMYKGGAPRGTPERLNRSLPPVWQREPHVRVKPPAPDWGRYYGVSLDKKVKSKKQQQQPSEAEGAMADTSAQLADVLLRERMVLSENYGALLQPEESRREGLQAATEAEAGRQLHKGSMLGADLGVEEEQVEALRRYDRLLDSCLEDCLGTMEAKKRPGTRGGTSPTSADGLSLTQLQTGFREASPARGRRTASRGTSRQSNTTQGRPSTQSHGVRRPLLSRDSATSKKKKHALDNRTPWASNKKKGSSENKSGGSIGLGKNMQPLRLPPVDSAPPLHPSLVDPADRSPLLVDEADSDEESVLTQQLYTGGLPRTLQQHRRQTKAAMVIQKQARIFLQSRDSNLGQNARQLGNAANAAAEQRKAEKEAAALAIQCAQRQRIARQQIAAKRRARQQDAQKKADGVSQQDAVLKIQSAQRQRQARRDVAVRRSRSSSPADRSRSAKHTEQSELTQQDAALKIQSAQRQRQARSDVAARRSRSSSPAGDRSRPATSPAVESSDPVAEEKTGTQESALTQQDAALKIQCAQRQRTARQDIASRRLNRSVVSAA